MKATKSLPTEQRCKDMSDIQWLWYYLNLIEEEEENAKNEELKWKARFDYLAWWINPQLAKSVMEAEKGKKDTTDNDHDTGGFSKTPKKGFTEYSSDGSTETTYGDEKMNSEFERELATAMADTEMTEVPDSHGAGNHHESKDDFISRALGSQNAVNSFNSLIEHDADEEFMPAETIQIPNGGYVDHRLITEDDIDYFEYNDE